MKNIQKLLVLLSIPLLIVGCTCLEIYTIKKVTSNIPDKYQEKVFDAIKSAKSNKNELKKVLHHYKNEPKKLEAASFLIANMKGHKYVEFGIFDSLDNQIVYDVLDYENYHQITNYLDSLETEIGELHWDKVMEEIDIETVSANYLIKHIDLAYESYNKLPWTKNLGWKTFMEFVLPYRGSSEPISDWRTYFWENFASFRDSTDEPIELATMINKKCKEMFTFKDVYYLHPTDLGLEEMLETGCGRCEDMTNFTIYAMRANGLAVTSDYTPHWPNSSNNHAWNVLILSEKEAIPFMGAEANPGDYSIGKVAKVYRKLFFEEDETLASKLNEDEKAPAWLGGKNYRDVTNQYTETTNVRIDSLNSEKRFAYLSIFNSNKWKAIHWAEIDSTGNAIFTKMGNEIIYLPMYFVESDTLKDKDDKPKWELIEANNPFLLTENGEIKNFNNQKLENREKIENKFVIKEVPKGLKIEPEKEYEFLIWEKGDWTTLIDTTAVSDSLEIDYYYPKSLYKLQHDEDDDEKVRIFTIDDEIQIW